MMVYGWIEGAGIYCLSGQSWYPKCYDSSTTGHALTTYGALRYGTALGLSTHKYLENGETTVLPDRDAVLDGGEPDPREVCETAGNLWDEYSQTCEYNPEPQSPIIVTTGTSNKHKLTSATDGVLFDIDGNGIPEQVAWTPADAEIAFLALDRDGDGSITNGKELFGDVTLPGASNGFAALARLNMESNGGLKRGSVSSDDPLFARLLLWTDSNHNGISEPSELRAASEFLSDIGLS